MKRDIETVKQNITFVKLTKENVGNYKKLPKIYWKHVYTGLVNEGESPDKKCKKNFFEQVFSDVVKDDSLSFFIVMQSGKDMIGFALFDKTKNGWWGLDLPYDYGYVGDFYIQPEYRRHGFGRMLYEHIEKIIKDDGRSFILLHPDPVTGVDFWRAMGYSDTGFNNAWGHYFIYIKHLIKDDKTEEIEKSIRKYLSLIERIEINPYNKPVIKEVSCLWKEYCKEAGKKYRKNDVRKMAFNARKSRGVGFHAIYFERKIVAFVYKTDEKLTYILPEHRERLKNLGVEI